MSLKLKAAFKTDVGRQRDQNEDNPYTFISEEQERGLFIVADGMGGYRAGEVASQIAVQKISESLKHYLVPIAELPTIKLTPVSEQETIILDPAKAAESANQTNQHKTRKLDETASIKSVEDQFKAAIRNANKAIVSYGEERSSARGLGCTVTSALIQDDLAFIANVGDSRTYLYRNGELKTLTRDHSLVQRLVEIGQISAEEAHTHEHKNVITRSLGARQSGPAGAEAVALKLKRGDKLLLCSDGLTAHVMDPQIREILGRNPDPYDAARELIVAANAGGGTDNISVIVVYAS